MESTKGNQLRTPEEDELTHGGAPANGQETPQEGPSKEDLKAEATAKAIQQAIEQLAREDEQPHSSSSSLWKIISGDFLDTKLLRKNIWLIVIFVGFVIVSISNRYSTQKSLIEIDKLNKRLEDVKYRTLSSNSQLTERIRESHVLEALRNSKDSVLKLPSHPPYIIQVPKK